MNALVAISPPQRSARRPQSLRIAMVAPPYFTVPPVGYGGVEEVVANLVDALVDRGHHITLIAAGSHGTRAQRFVATLPEPRSSQLGEPLPEVTHAARVAQVLEGMDIDLVHDHTQAGPLLARGHIHPTVVTVHGPVSGDEGAYYRALEDTVRLIGISDAQRAAAPSLPWLGTVHNPVRVETFPFQALKEDFALFLGRFHPDKAPHLAIDAARKAGLRIVLAGKCIERVERRYYREEIEPRLGADTEIFGMADASAKRDLLARACCLLFPIRWDEPFGLVMIEAMACGTPVVALRRGSVPEIVEDGRTGVIVDDPDTLAEAIDVARTLDPSDCRAHVATRFAARTIAARYEAAYVRMLTEPAGRRLTAAEDSAVG